MKLNPLATLTQRICTLTLALLLSLSFFNDLHAQHCDTFPLPFQEDFESYTPTFGECSGNIIPDCWSSTFTGEAHYQPSIWEGCPYYQKFSGKYLVLTAGGNAKRAYITLPYLKVDLNELYISFDAYTEENYGKIILGYFSDTITKHDTTFVPLDTISAHKEIQNHRISLYHRSIPADAVLTIQWHNNSFEFRCFIDNVVVDFEPCVPATDFQLVEFNKYSARLNWGAGREEAQWRIEYGPDGYRNTESEEIPLLNSNVDEGSETDADNDSITEVDTTAAVDTTLVLQADSVIFIDTVGILLTNLTPQKRYNIYLQSVCHSENLSEYIGPITFTTYCYELGDTTVAWACQEYEWRGHRFDRSGTYFDTVPDVAARSCDSIYTLDLTIYPVYDLFDTLRICRNELPYTWRDTTFQENAVTSDLLFTRTSEHTCDSLTHLHLIVYDSYDYHDTVVICQNDLPYTYGDTIFGLDSHSDIYVMQRNSMYGCDSIIRLHLTINKSYRQSEVVRICQQELPYRWRDTTFAVGTLSDVYTFYRHSALGCDSIVDLTLLVRPSYNEEVSLSICRSELPYEWRDTVLQNGTQSGVITFRRRSALGCDSIVTLNLTILELQTREESLTLCDRDLPYRWFDTTFQEGTTSGRYEILRDNNLCGIKYVLNLTVNQSVTTTFNPVVCRYDFPYEVADTLFEVGTSSGTYYLHRTSSQQCDSTVIINMQVKDVEHEYDTATLCRYDLPAVLHGTTFDEESQSGNYVLRGEAANGCSYNIYLRLNIIETLHLYDTLSICASELPTVWQGKVIARGTTSGDYTYINETVAGCKDTLRLHLIVYPSYRMNEEIEICANELPYTWRDTTFGVGSLSGMYLFERTSAYGCDSIVRLTLTIHETKYEEIALTYCENDFPIVWRDTTFQAGTEAGDFRFVRQTRFGCDSITVLHLNINETYEEVATLAVCDQDFPVIWRDTIFFAGSHTGRYTFHRRSAQGCDSIVHLDLSVNPTYHLTFADTLCDSDLPWTWSDTLFDVGTTSGTYTRTYVSSKGCDSVRVLHLVVNPTYSVESYLEICQNELPYTLEEEEHTFRVGTTTGDYTFTYRTTAGCDSIINLHLVVHPAFELHEEEVICTDELPYVWQDTLFEVGTVTGEYIFHRYTQMGCDSIIHLSLQVNEIPVVEILGDTLIDLGASTMLVATYGVGNIYEWSNGVQGNILNVSPDTTTTYTLTVTNSASCQNTFSVTVHVATGINDRTWNHALTLYPNPTDGKVVLNIEEATINYVELYNVYGSLVDRKSIKSHNAVINYSHITAGTYMIKIHLDNQASITRKIVIR